MHKSSTLTLFQLFFAAFITISCSVKRAPNAEPAPQKSLTKISDTVRIIPVQKDKTLTTRTLIIYYDEEVGDRFLLGAVKEIGAVLVYEYKTLKGIAVRIPEQQSVESAITYFKKVKGVRSVHRDRIYSIDPPVRSSVR